MPNIVKHASLAPIGQSGTFKQCGSGYEFESRMRRKQTNKQNNENFTAFIFMGIMFYFNTWHY